jgi:polyferredoxin
MKFNVLKTIRIVSALLIFIPLLLYFCDFANVLPQSLHGLAHVQVVPAVLNVSTGILTGLFLLTFFFGRIYCSVICPLGILQDIIAWFTKRGKKKRRWFVYAKPQSILRYFLLIVCILFLIFGITVPILYLDPYSNFGRIAVNLFRPVVMEGNNLVNWVALKFDNYDFYHVTIYTVTNLSTAIAAVALLVVGITALLKGRLFCNTICPVGSALGIISKFSVFKVVLDSSGCTSCGLCERSCKSQCISSKAKTIDNSRCVVCFNCLDRCKTNGIKYRFAYKRAGNLRRCGSNEAETRHDKISTRRSFLLTSAGMMATLPFIPAWAKKNNPADVTKLTPITPPGSKSLAHFKKHCTACHLCITHCPQQVLKPAGFNFGLDYVFKPHLVFYEMAFCNYECTVCSEICPNGAIQRLTSGEKSVTQVGIARFNKDRCVVYTDHTSCGACSEHCPTRAVKMEPYEGALTLPHVYDELCIGCGGCESICPVRPVKAINIQAVEIHQLAKKEEEEQIEEIDQDKLDFGF